MSNKAYIMDQIHKFDLTKLFNNIIKGRHSFGIVLLCLWGAFDLGCIVQLKKKMKLVHACIKPLLLPFSKYLAFCLSLWSLTLSRSWKSFPVRVLSDSFSSLGLAEMTVLRSYRRYEDLRRRSFWTDGHAFLSMNDLTPRISLADSFALAAASAGVSGCKKNLLFNGRSRSLASSEFSVPAASTHQLRSRKLHYLLHIGTQYLTCSK